MTGLGARSFAEPVGMRAEMADYRAYTIGHEGHFIAHRAFVCENDADAIEWAKQLVDGHDIELWNEGRFVIRLVRNAKKRAARG
jgi:hypothetical protein